MPRMKILSSVEQETFDRQPLFLRVHFHTIVRGTKIGRFRGPFLLCRDSKNRRFDAKSIHANIIEQYMRHSSWPRTFFERRLVSSSFWSDLLARFQR